MINGISAKLPFEAMLIQHK